MPLRTTRLAGPLALVLACTVLVAAPAVARKRDRQPSTGLGAIHYLAPPPDFAYDVGAGPQRLSSLAGRVVVLNFWATWCEPCRAELDAFKTLIATYGPAVPVLTVSAERPGVARAFLAAQHLVMPVVEDPARKIFAAYSVTPIPVTLVLGCDGTVRHVSVGELDWNELHLAVASAALPAGRPPSPGPSLGPSPAAPASAGSLAAATDPSAATCR